MKQLIKKTVSTKTIIHGYENDQYPGIYEWNTIYGYNCDGTLYKSVTTCDPREGTDYDCNPDASAYVRYY